MVTSPRLSASGRDLRAWRPPSAATFGAQRWYARVGAVVEGVGARPTAAARAAASVASRRHPGDDRGWSGPARSGVDRGHVVPLPPPGSSAVGGPDCSRADDHVECHGMLPSVGESSALERDQCAPCLTRNVKSTALDKLITARICGTLLPCERPSPPGNRAARAELDRRDQGRGPPPAGGRSRRARPVAPRRGRDRSAWRPRRSTATSRAATTCCPPSSSTPTTPSATRPQRAEAEARKAARRPRAPAGCATCRSVRRWALANQHEFALIFGSPVPGYRAPRTRSNPLPASRC